MSEAEGTYARGSDDGEDAALAYDMLSRPRNTRNSPSSEKVRRALGRVAEGGNGGVRGWARKRHLAPRRGAAPVLSSLAPLAGEERSGFNRGVTSDARRVQMLRKAALSTLRKVESFDRGLYWGRWDGSAPRSRVCRRHSIGARASEGDEVSLYAGVGVVGSAHAQAEWHELNLKTNDLSSLCCCDVIGELTQSERRLGGYLDRRARARRRDDVLRRSRKSIDASRPRGGETRERERRRLHRRTLARFLRVGEYARGASQPAAVICSSGTAVVNLLPSVVEASESSNAPYFAHR